MWLLFISPALLLTEVKLTKWKNSTKSNPPNQLKEAQYGCILKLGFSADKEEEQGSRKRVRLDLFLQIPRSSRTPTPQMEPRPWVHYVAMTPDEPEEPQVKC